MTIDSINKIQRELNELKRVIEKKPERFSFGKEIIRAFFGALLIGIVFIFSSTLLEVVEKMSCTNVIAVIIVTLLILIIEIYAIGYLRVKGEKGRNALEFIMKRLPMIYVISLFVSLFLIYLFGIEKLFTSSIWKLVFVVALPCSTGAAVADLLKKY